MGLGTTLSNEFQLISSQKAFKEVILFNDLKKAFDNLNTCIPKAYDVAIIHGCKGIVSYTSAIGWTYKTGSVKCELGDILFIAYSKKTNQARLFIMQNKVDNGINRYSFYADLIQLELLSYRLKFNYSSRTKNIVCAMPNNLLNTAKYPSIATYGVFYKNGSSYNMTTYSATKIKPINPFKCSKHRKVVFDGTFDLPGFSSKKYDMEGAINLANFGDMLENLEIGEPIDNKFKAVLSRKFSSIHLDYDAEHIISDFGNLTLQLDDDYSEKYYNKMDQNIEFITKIRCVLLINIDGKEN